MIVEKLPKWTPANTGLSCLYNISFAVDVSHYIQLNTDFQGSPVYPKSLYINNYANQYGITIQCGGFNSVIPPYSAGSVDVRGFNDIFIICDSVVALAVACTFYDFVLPQGFQVKTFQPTGSTNDSLFSKVNGLYHFESPNGATYAIDSSGTLKNLVTTPPSVISSAKAMFGNSSLYLDGSSGAFSTTNFNNVVGGNVDFTIEFFLNVSTLAPGTSWGAFTLSAGVVGLGFNYPDATHSILNMGNVSAQIPNQQWAHVAFVYSGGTTQLLFINGALVNYSNTALPSANFVALQFNASAGAGGTLFMDELRITVGKARYTSNFAVPAAPFLDQ